MPSSFLQILGTLAMLGTFWTAPIKRFVKTITTVTTWDFGPKNRRYVSVFSANLRTWLQLTAMLTAQTEITKEANAGWWRYLYA